MREKKEVAPGYSLLDSTYLLRIYQGWFLVDRCVLDLLVFCVPPAPLGGIYTTRLYVQAIVLRVNPIIQISV